METHLLFRKKLKQERERRGWSQDLLAEKVGCDSKTVGRWERGERLPHPHHRQILCELFGIDGEELGLVGLTPEPASIQPCPIEMVTQQVAERVPAPARLEDWHEAPAPIHMHGREKEADELERWLIEPRCRVIAVSGMGGMGKSVLVSTAANHLKENFECIFWRSLHSTPPLELLVKQFLSQFSQRSPADLPEALDDLLPLLMQHLRNRRCLVVLDNLESIMQPGQLAGCYREGYAAYGKLIRLFAETSHRSCLVLISREKPKEVTWLEGPAMPVRTLSLAGIDPAGGQKFLKERGLTGSKRGCAELIERCSGNPLVLQQISGSVRQMFGGSIAHFLQQGVGPFEAIIDLLEQHLQRLFNEEREILYWLAIEREPVPLGLLHERLAHSMSSTTLLETLDSLHRRSLIAIKCPAHFSLPAIFTEYVTNCLFEQACQEFMEEKPGVWMTHALSRARSKNDTRENQPCPLLALLAQRLLSTLGKRGIEQKAKSLLATQRQQEMQHPAYLAGNILNLLSHAGCNPRSYTGRAKSSASSSGDPQHAAPGKGETTRELVTVEK